MSGYVVARDFAGVRNGRSATFVRFVDANLEAMRAASEYGQVVRVFAANGEHVVSYKRGASGFAMVARLGDVGDWE